MTYYFDPYVFAAAFEKELATKNATQQEIDDAIANIFSDATPTRMAS